MVGMSPARAAAYAVVRLISKISAHSGTLTQLSWLWRSACKSLGLPRVSFHALRHTHASALIAAGLDVVVISRRLGHGSPNVTLKVYAHLFKRDDSAAAAAIEAVMRTRSEPRTP
jgi:integrase